MILPRLVGQACVLITSCVCCLSTYTKNKVKSRKIRVLDTKNTGLYSDALSIFLFICLFICLYLYTLSTRSTVRMPVAWQEWQNTSPQDFLDLNLFSTHLCCRPKLCLVCLLRHKMACISSDRNEYKGTLELKASAPTHTVEVFAQPHFLLSRQPQQVAETFETEPSSGFRV